MDDDMVGSGISMMAGRNVARAAATALAAAVVLIAALQGSALAAAPELTIGQPTQGSATDQQTPVFTGTSTDVVDPVTLQIYAGGTAAGTPVQTLPQPVLVEIGPTEASWEITPASLEPGEYTAVAEQTNAEAVTGVSPPVTFTVETPPVVALTSPGEGAVLKDSEPTLTGSAGTAYWDGPVNVTVHAGNSLAGPEVASGSVAVNGGTWSYSPHLSDGIYTAQATQSDEVGDTGTSAPVTFLVDATAPVVSMAAPESPTKDATPALTGGGATTSWDDPSVTVTIYEGTSISGNHVASEGVSLSGPSWSYTTPPLKDGIYTAQATQEDEAGNVGRSAARTFVIDTPPPIVSVSEPTSKVLHVTQPTFSGSATDEQAPVVVKVYAGASVSSGALKETLVAPDEAGLWTIVAGQELSNGNYTVQAEQSDVAGNVGKSKPVTFSITSVLTIETSGFQRPGRSGLVAGPMPSFQGSALSGSGASHSVVVRIFPGLSTSVTPEREVTVERSGARWATGPVEALPGGVYTVQAEQGEAQEEFSFTVDATPPQVTLTTPANGSSTSSASQTVGGSAGTDEGDLPRIAIHLYAGSVAAGYALQSISTEASGASWSATLAGLDPGTYTALAEQEDDVGNVGRSEPVTFTVLAPVNAAVTPSPPVAAFKWIPADPQTGEPVTLASSSSDGSSPITGYAWALAGNGVFTGGEAAITTSFSTPGPHVVQLRVTDANGLSSTVAETIAVASAPVPLMQPFPVVRMSGSFGASGAKISLLAAVAPVGATVTITCRGHGCPAKSQAFLATSPSKSKSGAVTITFRRFERFLRGGVVLEIWISKHGQIGKFTRFVIHRGKSPSRVDLCLNPAGTTPLVCPS
jgi:large repetitive protein